MCCLTHPRRRKPPEGTASMRRIVALAMATAALTGSLISSASVAISANGSGQPAGPCCKY
jgi:hypothetical protein